MGGEGHLQSWATSRRGSNPRLESDGPIIVDIPPTPPFKNSGGGGGASFLSLVLPFDRFGAWSASTSLGTAAVIASWYLSNIGILLLNKYLLSFHGFRYPIFLTALHMVSCSLYSSLSVHTFRLVPLQRISTRRQLYNILALSLIFCLSVVCGNTSLRYLPVSFNQAVGATTPFFTAAFSFLLTCRREHPLVYLTLLPIVLGILLATNSEPLFHPLGFLFCLASTAGRALKSVIQGILLSSDSDKISSINLLLYMAPIAAALLLPLSLYIEGDVASLTLRKARDDPRLLLLLFANATVAYLVNLTNFLVTKHTSALTLQVLGNAKAAVAAVVSVMIFRNPVTVMGMVGFGITIGGVVLYSEARKRTKNTTTTTTATNINTSGGNSIALLNSSNSTS
ncbi:putative BTB/POZ domain-containing protein [Iris pallida]|uniref:BTB/POZ domain-containing protein n=1 Tax=Iris pallida TaxID=29817 RepID=A0AAX6GC87_IRIPA|nr:putative BTB/POZ domain-containing protein [Iris pallida]